MYSGSSGYVGQNDIRYYNWGIGAIWGASPASYWPSSQRNNRITNCQRGLKVYHLSYPNFGPIQTSPYSYNSIYSNNYNVDLNTDGYNTSTLNAAGNYWATTNPTSTFLIGSGSQVNWQAVDPYDPWSGFPLPLGSQMVAGNAVNPTYSTSRADGPGGEIQSPGAVTAVQDSLQVGIGLREQSRHNEAKDFFISYLNRHPDDQAAYVYLYSCADSQTIADIITFFKSLPSQAAKGHMFLLSNLYLMQGDISDAKQVNNAITEANPNTSLGVRGKLNNFHITLFNDNDPNSASGILKEVSQSASLLTSMELSDAEHALATYVDPKTGTTRHASYQPSANSDQQSAVSTQQEQVGLSDNYPNPFNPTTIIKYQLVKSGQVTLKVYDILGREVATLVNQNQGIGVHSATFDGSRLASGVYFYRLTEPGLIQVKKMLLTK